MVPLVAAYKKAAENKNEPAKFEFQIGRFLLNSKLRYLKFENNEPIKLSPVGNGLDGVLLTKPTQLVPMV